MKDSLCSASPEASPRSEPTRSSPLLLPEAVLGVPFLTLAVQSQQCADPVLRTWGTRRVVNVINVLTFTPRNTLKGRTSHNCSRKWQECHDKCVKSKEEYFDGENDGMSFAE